MKNLSVVAGMIFCVASYAHAVNQTKVDSKTLHVDGAFEGKNQPVKKVTDTDDELKFLRNELGNVKNLKNGYKKKSKVYQKLSEESEELKDQFEGYLDNRVDYEKAISGYNTLVECLKTGDAKKCTQSKSKRRRKGDRRARKANGQRGYRGASNSGNSTYSDSIEIRQSGVKRNKGKSFTPNAFVREVDYRIAMRQGDLVSCYKKGNGNEEGVLKVVLKIAPNGNLNHLGFKDTTHINDRKLIRCVSRVLYSIVYPRTPNKKIVAVSKPFVFNRI